MTDRAADDFAKIAQRMAEIKHEENADKIETPSFLSSCIDQGVIDILRQDYLPKASRDLDEVRKAIGNIERSQVRRILGIADG